MLRPLICVGVVTALFGCAKKREEPPHPPITCEQITPVLMRNKSMPKASPVTFSGNEREAKPAVADQDTGVVCNYLREDLGPQVTAGAARVDVRVQCGPVAKDFDGYIEGRRKYEQETLLKPAVETARVQGVGRAAVWNAGDDFDHVARVTLLHSKLPCLVTVTARMEREPLQGLAADVEAAL